MGEIEIICYIYACEQQPEGVHRYPSQHRINSPPPLRKTTEVRHSRRSHRNGSRPPHPHRFGHSFLKLFQRAPLYLLQLLRGGKHKVGRQGMACSPSNLTFVIPYSEQYEDKDFSAKIQALYNELRLRSRFEKARKGETADFVDAAEEAWENYESILERESKEVSFPPIVAWVRLVLCRKSLKVSSISSANTIKSYRPSTNLMKISSTWTEPRSFSKNWSLSSLLNLQNRQLASRHLGTSLCWVSPP